MRRHALIVIALAAAAPASAQQRRIFVSPMGQPFHGSDAAPDPERAWFTAVDANGDGIVTAAEFQADAARFFATLDRKHDGEIDPDDVHLPGIFVHRIVEVGTDIEKRIEKRTVRASGEEQA